MTNTTTHTYTNDGMENPYTVHRILMTTCTKLLDTNDILAAIETAMAEVTPDVCDYDAHFAAVVNVADNAGLANIDVTKTTWQIRHKRHERLLAEARVYCDQLCPAVARSIPILRG
jgi:hypothetical protein